MSTESGFLRYLHVQIGDDAATLGELVCACDSFVEGSHFLRGWLSLAEIAHKALSVNVSDIYAMGAIPCIALLCISIPPQTNACELRELATAVRNACTQYGIALVGGDTIASPLLGLHFTLFGRKGDVCEILCASVPQHAPRVHALMLPQIRLQKDETHKNRHMQPRSKSWILRKGVIRGDVLCVSGNLGSSLRTLRWLLRNVPCPPCKRHARFYARRVGSEILPFVSRIVHAGLDISDGLSTELHRLSKLNHVGFLAIKTMCKESIQSGEEYEALVAVRKKNLRALLCKARARRVRFMPIAIATRGAYKGHGKTWH
ncbi:MAG: thiamine-phosphate kinase [Helicobacter sp.]|nr:thiamine-phosphate kinase [Helicobacter sp.]